MNHQLHVHRRKKVSIWILSFLFPIELAEPGVCQSQVSTLFLSQDPNSFLQVVHFMFFMKAGLTIEKSHDQWFKTSSKPGHLISKQQGRVQINSFPQAVTHIETHLCDFTAAFESLHANTASVNHI